MPYEEYAFCSRCNSYYYDHPSVCHPTEDRRIAEVVAVVTAWEIATPRIPGPSYAGATQKIREWAAAYVAEHETR